MSQSNVEAVCRMLDLTYSPWVQRYLDAAAAVRAAEELELLAFGESVAAWGRALEKGLVSVPIGYSIEALLLDEVASPTDDRATLPPAHPWPSSAPAYASRPRTCTSALAYWAVL